MNIFHFIQSIDITTGGPARSVTNLLSALIRHSSDNFKLFTKQSDNPLKVDNSLQKRINFIDSYSSLRGKIEENSEHDLIFHGHGIWQSSIHKMAVLAQKNNIPYIISPRGMLEPWSLSQKKLKKLIALFFYQRNDIVRCSVIHATAQMEADNIRKLGFTNPIAVIPNGINLENFPKTPMIKKTQKKKVLFLSRIHKKKELRIF